MGTPPLTNLDLLNWFSADERSECSVCGRRSCVSVADAKAFFCLGCGAIKVAGVRIDVNGVLPGVPV